jgi:hypothetical protein
MGVIPRSFLCPSGGWGYLPLAGEFPHRFCPPDYVDTFR